MRRRMAYCGLLSRASTVSGSCVVVLGEVFPSRESRVAQERSKMLCPRLLPRGIMVTAEDDVLPLLSTT